MKCRKVNKDIKQTYYKAPINNKMIINVWNENFSHCNVRVMKKCEIKGD